MYYKKYNLCSKNEIKNNYSDTQNQSIQKKSPLAMNEIQLQKRAY